MFPGTWYISVLEAAWQPPLDGQTCAEPALVSRPPATKAWAESDSVKW